MARLWQVTLVIVSIPGTGMVPVPPGKVMILCDIQDIAIKKQIEKRARGSKSIVQKKL